MLVIFYIYDSEIIDSLNFTRSVRAFEIDYTYDLIHGEFLDTKLYGEVIGISYPEEIFYIRNKNLQTYVQIVNTILEKGEYKILDSDINLTFPKQNITD